MSDINDGYKAQEEYCKDKSLPDFVPYLGICFNCGRSIFNIIHHEYKNPLNGKVDSYETGYTVEYASRFHITSCPHCHKSFCN